MKAEVRDGSPNDMKPCVDLWTRIIASRDGASVTSVVEQRMWDAFSRSPVRFAVVGRTPIGFALTLEGDRRIALLSRLCVDPTATSHGLGAALVTDAVHHARKAGFERINLDVRETNTRAIALYRWLQFRADSEPFDYDDGDPIITFSFELATIH